MSPMPLPCVSPLSPLAAARAHGVLALGPAIDAALGGGLALGALHEIAAEGLEGEIGALAAGFAVTVLGAIADPRPVIWIARVPDIHPSGLLRFGFDPGRLILAQAADDAAALAGMEIALRGGAAAAVVGEVSKLGRLSGRRLQLACLKRGTTGLLLRRHPFGRGAAGAESFAVTRWNIASAPSLAEYAAPGLPRWHLTLLAARGGTQGDWIVQPDGGADGPYPLRVVAGLAGPAAAPARRRAG